MISLCGDSHPELMKLNNCDILNHVMMFVKVSSAETLLLFDVEEDIFTFFVSLGFFVLMQL